MIKLLNCLRKRDDVSVDDFRRYWDDKKFDTLIRRAVELFKAEQCAKNLTLQIQANVQMMDDRGGNDPYDGVLEYWWKEGSKLMGLYETPDAITLRNEILKYQKQFVDFERSTIFFVDCTML